MGLVAAREAVGRSIRVLDDYYGTDEWLDRIDESNLDMMNAERCIMGQVFGDYEKGCDIVGVQAGIDDTYAFTEGFNFSFGEVAQAWKEALRDLRANRTQKEEAGDANVNLQVVKRYIPDPTDPRSEIEIIVMATYNKDIVKGAIMALNHAGIKCRSSETPVVE